jgi:translation initiation factor IF-2
MEGMLEPKIQEKIVANVEVRNVFKFDKATVAGCFVLDGKISRNNKIRIFGMVLLPIHLERVHQQNLLPQAIQG